MQPSIGSIKVVFFVLTHASSYIRQVSVKHALKVLMPGGKEETLILTQDEDALTDHPR